MEVEIEVDESGDQKGFKSFKLENGLKSNVRYSDLADFEKMKGTKILKIVVIGETGTGKSSMISKLMGAKLMHEMDEDKVEWSTRYGNLIRVDKNDLKDHFKVDDTFSSVTKETSCVLSRLLGNESRREVMLIDSPGFFDPEEAASEELREQMGIGGRKSMIEDLVEKLRGVGSVDAVVLMTKLEGGRIPLNLVKAMKSLEEMFKESKGEFISNLAIVMSKCDEDQVKHYYKKMKHKEKEYMGLIEAFQKMGVEVANRDAEQLFFLTAVDETLNSIGRKDEFERLFNFFNLCRPINTRNIEDPTEILQGIDLENIFCW